MKNKEQRFIGKKILIIEGYARQILPFLKYFKKCKCHTTVLCDSRLDVAYASRYTSKKILGVCNSDEYGKTVEWVNKLIKSGEFDLVLPMGDLSAKILADNYEEYKNYAIIAANPKKEFDASQNKQNVMLTCINNDIPCPKTLVDVQSMEDVLKCKLSYPVALKPRRSCGARGFFKIENQQELERIINQNGIDVKEQVIQEYIPQSKMNLSANFYVDKYGVVKAAFIYGSLRWFPLNGGTGTFNITIHNDRVIEQCEKLIKLLNLKGNLGVDLMYDDRTDEYKVLEINPRVMACAKIGFDAGVNLAKLVLEDAFTDSVTESLTYIDDRRVRMSQTDILWFIKSPNRFKCKPCFFSVVRTKDQTFSILDPLPWFAFLIRGLKNYKSEKSKRQM